MTFKANYEALSLSGTMTSTTLGDGITGSTVHQIYCLAAGAIAITPLKGDTFTWNGTQNASIDVLVSKVVISSGTFIGFKARNSN